MGDEVSQFRMSGFDSSDRWLELVRAFVRTRLVPVRVPRSDCPRSRKARNPDTRGTLGGPPSGSSSLLWGALRSRGVGGGPPRATSVVQRAHAPHTAQRVWAMSCLEAPVTDADWAPSGRSGRRRSRTHYPSRPPKPTERPSERLWINRGRSIPARNRNTIGGRPVEPGGFVVAVGGMWSESTVGPRPTNCRGSPGVIFWCGVVSRTPGSLALERTLT